MSENALAAALAAFHKDAPHIALDSVNPHFKNKYASLAGIMSAVRPALTAQGLVISQQPTTLYVPASIGDPGRPATIEQALRTTLLHVSGEKIEDVMLLAVDKPGPQAQGSALTYARRYAVLAILGLVGDEDDDAEVAQKEATTPQLATEPQRETMKARAAALLQAEKLTEEQHATITDAAANPDTTRAAAGKVLDRLAAIEKGEAT